MEHTLENKEIRGITAKLLRGMIWQTIIVVSTAVGFYFKLDSKIDSVVLTKDANEKYWGLKFDQIQIQNTTMQKQLEGVNLQNQTLQKQIDIISFRLDEIKPQK